MTAYQLALMKFWQCQRDFPGLNVGDPPTATLYDIGLVDLDDFCAEFSVKSLRGASAMADKQRSEALREFRRME